VEVCLAKANSHCQSGKTETSTTKKQIAEICTARIRAFFRSLFSRAEQRSLRFLSGL
jgi:hypothetical protein